MTKYIATINVPGYLPMDDDPPVFNTPSEAWAYLRDERERAEDDTAEEGDDTYSDTYYALRRRAKDTAMVPNVANALDTVHGPTPGYTGSHDLGLAYSVDVYTASLHSGQPDADELRRLPAITDLADPTTEQEDTDYGTLTDYRTGEPIRPATAAEHTRSLAAGGTGVFEDQDGRAVFVAGGPES